MIKIQFGKKSLSLGQDGKHAFVKIILITYALQTGQLSQAWESLVGAETNKVHLQERVDQLTRQLQGNEGKLAMYERRTAGINGAAPAVEQDFPREQQKTLEDTIFALSTSEKSSEPDRSAREDELPYSRGVDQEHRDPQGATCRHSSHIQGELVRSCQCPS